jgi:hypothetical protein
MAEQPQKKQKVKEVLAKAKDNVQGLVNTLYPNSAPGNIWVSGLQGQVFESAFYPGDDAVITKEEKDMLRRLFGLKMTERLLDLYHTWAIRVYMELRDIRLYIGDNTDTGKTNSRIVDLFSIQGARLYAILSTYAKDGVTFYTKEELDFLKPILYGTKPKLFQIMIRIVTRVWAERLSQRATCITCLKDAL